MEDFRLRAEILFLLQCVLCGVGANRFYNPHTKKKCRPTTAPPIHHFAFCILHSFCILHFAFCIAPQALRQHPKNHFAFCIQKLRITHYALRIKKALLRITARRGTGERCSPLQSWTSSNRRVLLRKTSHCSSEYSIAQIQTDNRGFQGG